MALNRDLLVQTAQVVRWTARARQLVEAAQPILDDATRRVDESGGEGVDNGEDVVATLRVGDIRELQRAVDAALDAMHSPHTPSSVGVPAPASTDRRM